MLNGRLEDECIHKYSFINRLQENRAFTVFDSAVILNAKAASAPVLFGMIWP